MIPFVWSTDRSESFESFIECYESWAAKAKNDPGIRLNEIFKTYEYKNEKDRRDRKGMITDARYENIKSYVEVEDEL